LDRKHHLPLLSSLATNAPDTRILDTRKKQPFGDDYRVRGSSTVPSIAFLKHLCLLLSIHASLQLTLAIELSMSTVVRFRTDRKNIQVIGVHLAAKLSHLILVVFRLILIFINASLLFEEGVHTSPFSTLLRTTGVGVLVIFVFLFLVYFFFLSLAFLFVVIITFIMSTGGFSILGVIVVCLSHIITPPTVTPRALRLGVGIVGIIVVVSAIRSLRLSSTLIIGDIRGGGIEVIVFFL
jgi:hypothetical protein